MQRLVFRYLRNWQFFVETNEQCRFLWPDSITNGLFSSNSLSKRQFNPTVLSPPLVSGKVRKRIMLKFATTRHRIGCHWVRKFDNPNRIKADPVCLNRRKCTKFLILLPSRSVTLVTSNEANGGRFIAILLRFRAITFVRLRSVKKNGNKFMKTSVVHKE